MSSDEFDDIPDELFSQLLDWDQPLVGPMDSNLHGVPVTVELGPDNSIRAEDSDSSSYSFSDFVMDAAFFAELDSVERMATGAPPVADSTVVNTLTTSVMTATTSGNTSSHEVHPSIAPQNPSKSLSSELASQIPSTSKFKPAKMGENIEQPLSMPRKRPSIDDSSQHSSKGKMKAVDNLLQVLMVYDDELTCPICCDIFVAPHVGNPCGHTFCGECGWQWHIEKKNKSCPCCRGNLHVSMPMTPNIVMDNVVERHIHALALSGMQEWEPNGRKYLEWESRKQQWRNGSENRERKRRKISIKTTNVDPIQRTDVDNWIQGQDDVEQDPTYIDSDSDLIPRPIRRAPRRRNRQRRSEVGPTSG